MAKKFPKPFTEVISVETVDAREVDGKVREAYDRVHTADGGFYTLEAGCAAEGDKLREVGWARVEVRKPDD